LNYLGCYQQSVGVWSALQALQDNSLDDTWAFTITGGGTNTGNGIILGYNEPGQGKGPAHFRLGKQLPSRTPGSIATRVAPCRAIALNSSRWMYAAFQGSWPKSYQNVSPETIGDITLDMTNPIGG
jgi:hypothetical protein